MAAEICNSQWETKTKRDIIDVSKEQESQDRLLRRGDGDAQQGNGTNPGG